MKPHPRIRKAVKWGGGAVTVLLVAGWIASGRGFVAISDAQDRAIAAISGCLYIQTGLEYRFDMPLDWGLYDGRFFFLLWPFGETRSRGVFILYVPFWIPALLTGAVAAMAWRLDALARRRARHGLCPKCHYDRAGLAAGAVCPECGAGAV